MYIERERERDTGSVVSRRKKCECVIKRNGVCENWSASDIFAESAEEVQGRVEWRWCCRGRGEAEEEVVECDTSMLAWRRRRRRRRRIEWEWWW